MYQGCFSLLYLTLTLNPSVCTFVLPFCLAWQTKIKVYQGRFSLLYQRLRRNSRFAPLNAVQVREGGAMLQVDSLYAR